MLLKVLYRLCLAGCLVVSLLVTSACVAGYLALQEPRFYAELRGREPAPEAVEAVTQRLEQIRFEYVRWRSLARDHRKALAKGEDDPQAAAIGRAAPAPGVHTVRFTDEQLNTMLAAEKIGATKGQFVDPRVRVLPGRVEFVCGVMTPAARCVLSTELAPSITPQGVLTLELLSARVGYLPLPYGWLNRFVPRETHRLSGNLSLDLTAENPRVTLDLSGEHDELLAKSLECLDGEIAVQFVAKATED